MRIPSERTKDCQRSFVVVSAYEMQITGRRPSREMVRGLTLVCKILQTSVNRPSFAKESAMSHFNDLINSRVAAVNKYFSFPFYLLFFSLIFRFPDVFVF